MDVEPLNRFVESLEGAPLTWPVCSGEVYKEFNKKNKKNKKNKNAQLSNENDTDEIQN